MSQNLMHHLKEIKRSLFFYHPGILCKRNNLLVPSFLIFPAARGALFENAKTFY